MATLCEEFPDAVHARAHGAATEKPKGHDERALQLVAGMPELNACGLSETWLQKTCGSQHWLSLAQALGQPSDRWVDMQGRRVYAAFGWLHLREAALSRVAEGQGMRLHSRLQWLGRSHALSRHWLAGFDGAMAALDMLSVFVSRHRPGDNHSVRRADVPAAAVSQPKPDTAALLGHLRQWRLASETRAAGALTWTTIPCPRSDFNGAGLLYFPSFTAIADRAMWHWGMLETDTKVLSRECLFLGNVSVGESVDVNLLREERAGPVRRYHLQMMSCEGRRRLAEMQVSVEAST